MILVYIRGAYDKFPDFFRMGTFIDSKIGLSSHKMYSNEIQNFQESTTILNARIK